MVQAVPIRSVLYALRIVEIVSRQENGKVLPCARWTWTANEHKLTRYLLQRVQILVEPVPKLVRANQPTILGITDSPTSYEHLAINKRLGIGLGCSRSRRQTKTSTKRNVKV